LKVLNIVGARPNFMKIAAIIRAMLEQGNFEPILIHTGQHYDVNMSDTFFHDLSLPQPAICLEVGSGSHSWQTAQIMIRFEKLLIEQQPDLVLVVGDVNSTIACALVAAKMHVALAHVEAGLRSFDRTMPEEINRLVTDQLSDYLFTTCGEANENLRREGISEEKIHFVGNVMVDTLLAHLERAEQSDVLQRLGLNGRSYAVLILHRPSNVEVRSTLVHIIEALEVLQQQVPVVFPAHPRTMKQLASFGLQNRVANMDGLRLIEPLGYLDFLHLMRHSQLTLTDSGGIQEETTVLGVPCLTLRENTERPVTVSQGTNTLVGADPEMIVAESRRIISGFGKKGTRPELWDGKAAERIVAILAHASSLEEVSIAERDSW